MGTKHRPDIVTRSICPAPPYGDLDMRAVCQAACGLFWASWRARQMAGHAVRGKVFKGLWRQAAAHLCGFFYNRGPGNRRVGGGNHARRRGLFLT